MVENYEEQRPNCVLGLSSRLPFSGQEYSQVSYMMKSTHDLISISSCNATLFRLKSVDVEFDAEFHTQQEKRFKI